MDTHGYKNWVCTVKPKLSTSLPTINWPSPSFTRIKSCAAAPAGFQYLPERSSGWRAEMRHSMLWENWQDSSSDRYFQELISWAWSLYLLISRKVWKSFMVMTAPHDCSNLLQKICAWLHGVSLHQNHICTDHPHPHPLTSLELFLRSIQNAVSQAIVLILPLIKFDSHLSCCTFFLSRCLPFMSLSVLVRRQLRTFWCFIHDSASKWISTKVEHWNNNNWRMWYNVSILTILNASSQH